MAKRTTDKSRALVHVHCRLFKVDVAEMKRDAKETSIPWQITLRNLVHEARKRDTKVL